MSPAAASCPDQIGIVDMTLLKTAAAFAFALTSLGATAQAASIQSYSIENAVDSTQGGWTHSHSGTETSSGTSSSTYSSFDLVDYTDGTGSLNDGGPSTSHKGAHLLSSADNVIINLTLDAVSLISQINLFSFNNGNYIPGSISAFDITIQGLTETIFTTQDSSNTEFASLVGSGLDALGTTSIILSNFQTNGQFYDLFAISEITVDSIPATVPLPAGGVLLLTGLGGVVALKRKRSQAA